jgi:hypothetical protein
MNTPPRRILAIAAAIAATLALGGATFAALVRQPAASPPANIRVVRVVRTPPAHAPAPSVETERENA